MLFKTLYRHTLCYSAVHKMCCGVKVEGETLRRYSLKLGLVCLLSQFLYSQIWKIMLASKTLYTLMICDGQKVVGTKLH